MALIECHDLSFSYQVGDQEVPILDNVNLKIEEGEFVAIQGPSGSGKSTLLHLLGALSQVQKGEVVIANQTISQLNDEELAQFRNKELGFIFQQFHLLPKTSVVDNILMPTLYAPGGEEKSNRARATELATRLGLGDRLENHPNQLSGGQQQRVAIARALINSPRLILADEPTGNLDSKTSAQIIELLKNLNREGKTIVIITHDPQVAAQCDRSILIRDGKIVDQANLKPKYTTTKVEAPQKAKWSWKEVQTAFASLKTYVPMALSNLSRNKTRSLLTMIGISVGITAVLSMVTLGQFTKKKILAGYAEMGVNSLIFQGHRGWRQRARDKNPSSFVAFDWDKDILPLYRIFPEIEKISPLILAWNGNVAYGGKLIEDDVRFVGVNEHAFMITKRRILMGRNFTSGDIDQKHAVCIVGFEIAQKFFPSSNPLGEVVNGAMDQNTFTCKIVGVLSSTTSNKSWMKPNTQIFLPFSFYRAHAGNEWTTRITQVILQVQKDSNIEALGKGMTKYFEQKYGSSGEFNASSDSVLVAQMQRFLTLFTMLLGAIALVTLGVGGIGITNMMLVSVSERFREIGLRKAVGASSATIRSQFLAESLSLCAIAGIIGLVLGFVIYQSAIFGASKLMKNMPFEWLVDPVALILSIVSIIVVGLLSGIFPALKAERLTVIEALRSE